MNYEALGRYTEAVERFRRLLSMRNRIIADAARVLQSVAGNSSAWDRPDELDIDALIASLEEARRLQAEMLAAVAEANAVADAAKRPLLKP
jgi:predicted oxidoreductase